MELLNIDIKFRNIATKTMPRPKREAINPNYKIGQELKLQCIVQNSENNKYNIINVKIKDSKYSPSLEDNIYTIIILDTVGKIENLITEKDLINVVEV